MLFFDIAIDGQIILLAREIKISITIPATPRYRARIA
jgi:hypothetical protein